MKCDRCGGRAEVIGSTKFDDQVTRLRVCGCGARMTTWETRVDPKALRRQLKAIVAGVGDLTVAFTPTPMRDFDPVSAARSADNLAVARKAQAKRAHLRREAVKEAAETGENVETVRQRWGVA